MNLTATIFAVIALIYAILCIRDVLKNGRLSTAGRIWLRMVIIFTVVATGLLLVF